MYTYILAAVLAKLLVAVLVALRERAAVQAHPDALGVWALCGHRPGCRRGYTQFSTQDFGRSGPNPWKILEHYSTYNKKQKVPGPPNPWEKMLCIK